MRVANWAPLLRCIAASSPGVKVGRTVVDIALIAPARCTLGPVKGGLFDLSMFGVDVARLLSGCYYCDRDGEVGMGQE